MNEQYAGPRDGPAVKGGEHRHCTRTKYWHTHSYQTFSTARNHFLLLTDVCMRVWDRERGEEIGREIQRGKHWEGEGGEVHTEKLLINRLTVTLPPNRTRRMLTLSPLSIHLKTPGTLHWPPKRSPPTGLLMHRIDLLSHCQALQQPLTPPPLCLYVTPHNHVTLWAWDFLSFMPSRWNFTPALSLSLSESESLSLSAHWVTESVAKRSPFQPDQTFLPPYVMPWLLPACG